MQPYSAHHPTWHSVLVMDNCRIHHTDILLDTLNDAGESFELSCDLISHID